MMATRPRTMETMLSRRASRPSLRAPSMSPTCRLFLDWKKKQTKQVSPNHKLHITHGMCSV